MKKLLRGIFIFSISMSTAFAIDFYIVKFGDTLSQIIERRYPNQKLYGRRGKLVEVLKLNPDLENSDKIKPNQRIQLTSEFEKQVSPPEIEVKQSIPEVKKNAVTTEERLFETKKENIKGNEIEEWNISALYGVKYFSLTQSGALGNAEIGSIFFSNFRLKSEFVFNDWSYGLEIDSYKFKFAAPNSRDSEQMTGVNIYGSYKWLLGAITIEQNPLFKKNVDTIEMTKMSSIYLSIGAKKRIELSSKRPTSANFNLWGSYLLSSSTESADIKVDSAQGFRLMGQVELARQIISRADHSLHASWTSRFGYQNLSQNVEWGTSSGVVKSLILDASSSFGLLYKF